MGEATVVTKISFEAKVSSKSFWYARRDVDVAAGIAVRITEIPIIVGSIFMNLQMHKVNKGIKKSRIKL